VLKGEDSSTLEDLQGKGIPEEGGPQIKENTLKNLWTEVNLQDKEDHLEDPQDPRGPRDPQDQ